jgi:peptidyl-prolyl cis-trans isomerase A (cyclophilin A)
MKHKFELSIVALALLFAGTAYAQDQAASAKKPAATGQSTAAKPKSGGTDPGLLHPATLKAQAPAEYDAKFTTTKGDFVVHVTRAWAPLGADRFYNLVKHHFYDGAALFRVVSGFVVQFGLGPDPAVNKAWADAMIKDDPVTQSNKPGYVTYAAGGQNTRTTQVFINLGNNAALDKYPDHFAPFGQVTSGMDVVQQFYSGYADAPTGKQGEITSGGKAFLEKNYPKLDIIKAAVIVPSETAAPAAPAAKPKAQQPGVQQ